MMITESGRFMLYTPHSFGTVKILLQSEHIGTGSERHAENVVALDNVKHLIFDESNRIIISFL